MKAVFYTSTNLSGAAKEFSKRLGIKLYENKKMDKYPAIKCNVSSKGEKIYHLPFDQQYDKTKIDSKRGEKYCMTVSEAVKLKSLRTIFLQVDMQFKSLTR